MVVVPDFCRILEKSDVKFGQRDEVLSLVRGRHYQVSQRATQTLARWPFVDQGGK
jgi:hypothetical protein